MPWSPAAFSPAITPPCATRREQILTEARSRGWLAAPGARNVAEACLSAFQAGTLSEVGLLPSPEVSPSWTPDRQKRKPRSPDSASPARISPPGQFGAYFQGSSSTNAKQPPSAGNGSEFKKSPFDNILPSGVVDLTSPDRLSEPCDADKPRGASQGEVLSARSDSHGVPSVPHSRELQLPPTVVIDDDTPSPPLQTTRRRRPKSPLTTPSRTRRQVDFVSRRSDHRGYTSVASETIDVDEICRSLDSTLRLPGASPEEQPSSNRESHAQIHSDRWLGPANRPFAKVRDSATKRLLELFDREVLAGELVTEKGSDTPRVTVIWSGRLTKTAGITRMKRLPSGKRTAAIELSTKVVDEPCRLYSTLAHELCHAAAWIIDECARPPHGKVFKSWGAKFAKWNPQLTITTCHDYEIRYKYKYVCRGCGQVYGRHSKSIDTSKKVCGRCRGTLELEVRL